VCQCGVIIQIAGIAQRQTIKHSLPVLPQLLLSTDQAFGSEGPGADGGTGLNTGSTVAAGTAGVHIAETRPRKSRERGREGGGLEAKKKGGQQP